MDTYFIFLPSIEIKKNLHDKPLTVELLVERLYFPGEFTLANSGSRVLRKSQRNDSIPRCCLLPTRTAS